MSGEALLESDVSLVKEALANDEAARSYLRRAWLIAAASSLRDTRRRVGKTQGDVAKFLGTTQSAIARLEADHSGRFTLRRFIDYALACDAMPLDISIGELSDVRRYATSFQAGPRDFYSYTRWKQAELRHRWPSKRVRLEVELIAGTTSFQAKTARPAYSDQPSDASFAALFQWWSGFPVKQSTEEEASANERRQRQDQVAA